jgi:hypothetical protein
VVVPGGAKVGDKFDAFGILIGVADRILIGGAMAYPFLDAEGYKVGTSPTQVTEDGVVDRLVDGAVAGFGDLDLRMGGRGRLHRHDAGGVVDDVSGELELNCPGQVAGQQQHHDASEPSEDRRPRVSRAPAAGGPGQVSSATQAPTLCRAQRSD